MSEHSITLAPARRHIRPRLSWLVVGLACAIILTFLLVTPPGVLTKADMVAYAVCHRIPAHSFSIAGRPMPLCARCSGTFLGALTGFVGQAVVLRRRRASELPPPLIVVLLVLFIGVMGADGLNSYLTLIPGAPYLYEPRNWLRLATGALNGLAMSALVYPIFNFTLWREPIGRRAVQNLCDLAVLLLLEAGMVGLVLTRHPLLLYPLALLSALGVLALLTCVNTMLVVIIVRRENTMESWREAVVPLLAGLTLGLLQIGAIDLLRYALTGTLEGFPLPGYPP